jgi:hypothetical protein
VDGALALHSLAAVGDVTAGSSAGSSAGSTSGSTPSRSTLRRRAEGGREDSTAVCSSYDLPGSQSQSEQRSEQQGLPPACELTLYSSSGVAMRVAVAAAALPNCSSDVSLDSVAVWTIKQVAG